MDGGTDDGTDGLVANDLSVRFGGVCALDAVDLHVGRGEIVGLIGPNGAGKTTLIDAATGFVASSGTIHVDGVDITGWPPHRRVRAGLSRTFQTAELFTELTVAEHLSVVVPRASGSGRPPPDPRTVLATLGLEGEADRRPAELSHGRRRLVGLARAVLANPAILLLDEPAAGLDSNETAELAAPLHALAAAGIGILLVDHDVDFVAATTTRAIALDFGAVIARGLTADVLADPAVHAAYLGTAPDPEPVA